MRFLGIIVGLVLLLTGTASALPLNGGTRDTIVGLVMDVDEALAGTLGKVKDGVALRGHAAASIEAFEEAVEKLQNGYLADTSDLAKCTQSSKEDERGLAEAFRVVRDGSKLKVSQFIGDTEFGNFRLALVTLATVAILAVDTNIFEAEVIGASASKIATARNRIGTASKALLVKGDLAKAADQAQSAYDLISGEANIPPACLEERLLPRDLP